MKRGGGLPGREVGESLFVSATLDSILPGRGVGPEKVCLFRLSFVRRSQLN